MSKPWIPEVQNKVWLSREDWLQRHQQMLERARGARQAGVVFLGDSITEGWMGPGLASWEEHMIPRNSLNLGIGGDETQHVLWRIMHGELEHLAPETLVLLIGTNNIGNAGHSGKDTARGIRRLVEEITDRLDDTHVIVHAILPRDQNPDTQMRREVAAANADAARVAEHPRVQWLDLSDRFLQPEGTIARAIMPDFLHLSSQGYRIWADALLPVLGAQQGSTHA